MEEIFGMSNMKRKKSKKKRKLQDHREGNEDYSPVRFTGSSGDDVERERKRRKVVEMTGDSFLQDIGWQEKQTKPDNKKPELPLVVPFNYESTTTQYKKKKNKFKRGDGDTAKHFDPYKEKIKLPKNKAGKGRRQQPARSQTFGARGSGRGGRGGRGRSRNNGRGKKSNWRKQR
eukprot:TRINITY_DN13272_c0_g1_i1.p2 TRINITY_DN13272_c0_g1~~TRINITY_DN13272_c0_g1_i1.p2  ORF type:complete len:174 (+),score=46.40 TRINITY_DN13272_c0_g1_i1:827-1348(+)